MLAELIGHVIVGIVRVVDAAMDVAGALFGLERKMKEGSRVGDSPEEAERQRWWQRMEDRWFVIALLLLLTAAALVIAVEGRFGRALSAVQKSSVYESPYPGVDRRIGGFRSRAF